MIDAIDTSLADQTGLRFAFGFFFGAILGSFATMLAYRLPRGESIVRPRSHCTSCGTTLDAFDLIPLVSWLAFMGKCRHCGASIGSRYIKMELACSLICAVATVGIGFNILGLILAYGIIVIALVWGQMCLATAIAEKEVEAEPEIIDDDKPEP